MTGGDGGSVAPAPGGPGREALLEAEVSRLRAELQRAGLDAGLRLEETMAARSALRDARDAAAAAAAGHAREMEAEGALNERLRRANTALEASRAALSQSEDRLRASERRLQATHDNAGIGIHEVDAEGRYLSSNETFARLTGFSMAELAGRTFFELIEVPAERAEARERFARLVRGELALDEFSHQYIDARGRRLWAEVRTTAVRGTPDAAHPQGRFLYGVRVVLDVTERRATEAALRDSEERFRLIVENARDYAIFIADAEDRVANWLPGAAAVFGWTAEEIVGQPAALLYLPEDRAQGVPEWEVETARARGAAPNVRWHLRRDGSRVFIEGSRAALRGPGGELRGFLKIGQDVTERRAAEARLRHSEAALRRLNETLETQVDARTAELRGALDALHAEALDRAQAEETLRQAQKMEAVGQLTGGIAHDFNNMLQGIAGGLELMQRRIEQGRAPEALRFVDAARQTVRRAASLTHRLLAFARRQALQPEPVVPDRVAESLAELIRRTVGPAVQLELQLADGNWPVLCDPSQLENALLNLAINARDAMPEGGRLTIATRHVRLGTPDTLHQDGAAPGDYVEIAVSDTGVGMDEATRERAFEPFFTTKPLGQGTGLGLSQLYGFVRQSFGVVRLDSAPGRGTTVRFFLPRHGQDAAAAGPDPAATRPMGGPAGGPEGGTVLLVEDEAGVRALAAEQLRDLGYAVLEAADGPNALRLLHGRLGARVALLVTDVGLPNGLNGRQLADAAREYRPGLPVLLVTGYAGSALADQLAPGMAVMSKPFSLDDLAARVREMIGQN